MKNHLNYLRHKLGTNAAIAAELQMTPVNFSVQKRRQSKRFAFLLCLKAENLLFRDELAKNNIAIPDLPGTDALGTMQ